MHPTRSRLKTVHFFVCWFFAVIIGSFLPIFFEGDLEYYLLFVSVAAIFSCPFLVLFLILVHRKLKAKPPIAHLHGYIFLIHLIGSVLTILALCYPFSYDLLNNLSRFSALVAGYFIIDSIFFHVSIALLYSNQLSNSTNDIKIDEL